MKYTILVALVVAVMLSACGKKEEETSAQKAQRVAQEVEQIKMNEVKSKVPTSEIVGKIQGREVYIHKLYDEKTGANCYFIDYNLNNLSCVK